MGLADISLTAAMRSNLLALKDTSGKMTKTQERLATGKKVNTPLDNPTNFFAAKTLSNSASDIKQLNDRINEGVETIRATSKGLEGIATLLESMKGIVDAAAITSDPKERQALAKSFDETYAQLNYLVRDTSYAGTNLISNSSGDPLTVTSDKLTIPLNPQGSADYTVEGKFLGSDYVLRETPGGEPVWIPDDRGNFINRYDTTPGTPVGNLSDVVLIVRMNPQSDTLGDLNGNGLLQAGEGTEIDFRLTNDNAAVASNISFGNATISTGWTFNANTGAFLGSVSPGQSIVTNMTTDLDLNVPAGTNGTSFSISLDFTSDGVTKGLTFGPITVGAITNGQVLSARETASLGDPTTHATDSLTLNSADYDAGIFDVTYAGPPIEQKTLYAETQGLQIYHSWAYDSFQSQTGIDAAKSAVENAMFVVRGFAEAIGTNSGAITIRGDFNNNIANTYLAGADNLTLADMNEEGANMLMLQTRQNLGMTTLGLASESAQLVLKIFQ